MKRKKIIAADLFCGAGGTSTGLATACKEMGFDLDLVAVNHWDVAISTHTKNHPAARHFNSAINEVDLELAVPGGKLHLLVASPECTHFSNARGGKPMSDQKRATPLDILRWLKNLTVENVLIENVREFQNWGPLGKDGRPLKARKGESFRKFIKSIERLGYTVEYRVLNAADYGDPTTRQRLFIIARLGKKEIVWPESSHSKCGTDGKPKWRAAREIIDWSQEGKSIFNRKKPLAPATLKRIEAGLRKFGGLNAEPFIVMLRNHGGAVSVEEPIKTVSASGAHHGLVQSFVIGQQSGSVARSTDDPVMTVSAAGAISLVEPYLVNLSHMGTEGNGEDPDSRRCYEIGKPLPTVTGKGQFGFIVPQFSEGPPKSLEDPLGTLTTTSRGVGLCEPFIVPYFGEQEGEVPRTHSVDEPLTTITAGGVRQSLVEPFMVPFFGEGEHQLPRTHSLDQPMPTVTPNAPGLVEPVIMCIDHGSSNGNPRSVGEPLPTVTGKERLGVIEPYVMRACHPNDMSTWPVDEPIRTITSKEQYALVTPDKYRLDIRFRMLQPHELAKAMSFPEDYEFTGNREKTVKQIGNAVPGGVSRALCTQLLKAA